MRYSIKIPILITLFFILGCLYEWTTITSEWVGVFWACYKNVMLVTGLYFLYNRAKILYTDKIFIGGLIITSTTQALMYSLCPFSTEAQKYFFFNLYAWFIVLVGSVCITLYLKELLGGNGN